MLRPKTERVLAAIRAAHAQHGRAPSRRELLALTDVKNLRALDAQLKLLRDAGHLRLVGPQGLQVELVRQWKVRPLDDLGDEGETFIADTPAAAATQAILGWDQFGEQWDEDYPHETHIEVTPVGEVGANEPARHEFEVWEQWDGSMHYPAVRTPDRFWLKPYHEPERALSAHLESDPSVSVDGRESAVISTAAEDLAAKLNDKGVDLDEAVIVVKTSRSREVRFRGQMIIRRHFLVRKIEASR